MPRICSLLLAGSLLGSGLSFPACSSPPPASHPEMEDGRAQQALVDHAAQAVQWMRDDPRYAARLEPLLAQARAVVVFPRLVKASVLFGGEGGNGVMVARKPDGSWSAPAFYSLAAASAGLQIGYQETSVVFLLMNQRTVESALGSRLRLGTDASVVAADVGEDGQSRRRLVGTADICQFAHTGGVFAGVSLEGFVMTPRGRHNHEYYGRRVAPREVLVGGTADRPESAVLKEALRPRESPAPAEAEGSTSPSAAPAASLRECSPESRQAERCIQLYRPVCAEIDTGVRCVQAPCDESRAAKTYGNACEACRDEKVLGYREGECAGTTGP
jgi:SH3 domain-containing YSC84-like protein 1